MRARDPRWIILLEDGSYSTIGRHRQPDDDDIARADGSLERAGLSGWLAVLSQSEHSLGVPEVLAVRELRGPAITFDDAKKKLLVRIAEQNAGELD
jgi:hypothetical protein